MYAVAGSGSRDQYLYRRVAWIGLEREGALIISSSIQIYKKTIDLIRFKMKITALNDQIEPASGQGETKKPTC
jgi:hypothetical protein